jgi:hypothetical protein
VLKNNVFGVKELLVGEGAMENLFVGGVPSCLQSFDCWWVILYDPNQVFMAGKT